MTLDRTRRVWYLLLRIFWLLLPKFNIWKGDWALSDISTQIWYFSNISLFPKILSLKSLLTREATHIYQACYTRDHVSFYLWLIGSVLKHCKVPKYYGQACLKIWLLISKLSINIQILWKNAHLVQIVLSKNYQ